MTYGASTWWTPTWYRQMEVAKDFRKVQAAAARWITGAFKTTKVGALEIMAGLAPVRDNINRLMSKSMVRTSTLDHGHQSRKDLRDYRQHVPRKQRKAIDKTFVHIRKNL